MKVEAAVWKNLPRLVLGAFERGIGIAAGLCVVDWIFSRPPPTLIGAAVEAGAISLWCAVLVAGFFAVRSYDALKSLNETGFDLESEFSSSAFADRFLSEHYVKLRRTHLGD